MRFKHIVIYGTLLIMACNNHTKDHKKGGVDKDTTPQGADTSKPANIDTNKVIEGIKEERADTIFSASGTEPFWTVEIIKDKAMVFTTGDGFEVSVPYVEPTTVDKVSRYISSDVKSRSTMVISITPKKCSDGMSEKDYKYEVIAVINTVTYRGCGTKKF